MKNEKRSPILGSLMLTLFSMAAFAAVSVNHASAALYQWSAMET